MTVPRLGKLERVSLRRIWPHEEHHFTPWLVENLDQLSETLDIPLDQPKREARLQGAGRVDILAEVRSDDSEETAKVVIENQYGASDESHFQRLLGYAASSDASILVWVAEEFTNGYIRMMEWLNRWGADGNKIYAVEARALQIGDSVAVDFQVKSGPPVAQGRQRRNTVASMATTYGEFYRPVVAQLRTEGLPPVSRGGWRGKWRSFQTGYPPHVYSLGLEDTGEAKAYFESRGENAQSVYDALRDNHSQIEAALGDAEIEWHQGEQVHWIALKTKASLDATDEEHEPTRKWMASNLLNLRAAIQPHLEQMMSKLKPAETDDAAPLQNNPEPTP